MFVFASYLGPERRNHVLRYHVNFVRCMLMLLFTEHHLTGKHGSLVNKQPEAGEHVSSHRMPDGSVWGSGALS